MTSTRSSTSQKSRDASSDNFSASELEREFNISHDDLERAYEDFVRNPQESETPEKDKTGVTVASVIAGGVGVVMLMMMLQLAGLEIGPDLSFTNHLAIPLVVLLSGLLIWSRRRSRKRSTKQWEEDKKDATPDLKIRRPGSSDRYAYNSSKTAGDYEKSSGKSEYDAYAFKKKKRLFRTRRDRKFLGVCGGIANYFGFDPTVVRIIFVLSTIFYGSTLLIYIILGIVLPKAPENKRADI